MLQLQREIDQARRLERIYRIEMQREGAGSDNPLTPRQTEIIQMIWDGKQNKEIANELNISERTAKHHVSRLLEKFKVKRRFDL